MVDPPYRMKNFHIGTIILWFGAIAAIPSGYVLCDGNMGTPDLRDQFVVGAGDTYAVDDTGGADWHRNALVAGTEIAADATVREILQGIANFPPYHALCYIMKVN